jgi:hypothetical protein
MSPNNSYNIDFSLVMADSDPPPYLVPTALGSICKRRNDAGGQDKRREAIRPFRLGVLSRPNLKGL